MKIKNKKQIQEKKAVLENARIALKEKFVGIDDIIDKFISSVETWFIYPELMRKPLIVNLWGITGVGKTALVREFTKQIGFLRGYCELDYSSCDTYMMKDMMYDAGITNDTQGIILIDEFQKMRTVNEKNEEVEDKNQLVDIWTFLSDGTFPVDPNLKCRIENLICEYKSERKPTSYMDERFKSIMASIGKKQQRSVSDKVFSKQYVLSELQKAYEIEDTYTAKPFTNLLIIISGNLDEAFYFSGDVFDPDTDADIYNEMSEDIRINSIKKALLRRFRPEQIARLGNIHLIYPVLGKNDYEKLIKKYVDEYISIVEEKYSFDIEVDQSVLDAIYKNGVYPVQGVRPVFTTITMILENSVSNLISQIISNEKRLNTIKSITISYSDGSVSCKVGRRSYSVKINETLTNIRSEKTENMLALHSVHEAGHAVVQAVLFGVAPRQLVATTSDSSTGGFCSIYRNSGSRTQIKDSILVSLAGRAAEEIVFGQDNLTFGASSDLKQATISIMSYVYFWSMDGTKCVHDGNFYLNYQDRLDDRCDSILDSLYQETLSIIKRNINFIMDVADELMKNKSIKPDKFIEIAKNHNHNLITKKINSEIECDFNEMYKKFKEKNG